MREKISFDELDLATYSFSRLLQTYNELSIIIVNEEKDLKDMYEYNLRNLQRQVYNYIKEKTFKILENTKKIYHNNQVLPD